MHMGYSALRRLCSLQPAMTIANDMRITSPLASFLADRHISPWKSIHAQGESAGVGTSACVSSSADCSAALIKQTRCSGSDLSGIQRHPTDHPESAAHRSSPSTRSLACIPGFGVDLLQRSYRGSEGRCSSNLSSQSVHRSAAGNFRRPDITDSSNSSATTGGGQLRTVLCNTGDDRHIFSYNNSSSYANSRKFRSFSVDTHTCRQSLSNSSSQGSRHWQGPSSCSNSNSHSSRRLLSSGSGSGSESSHSAAAQPQTWVDRWCPRQALPYAKLMRLDKPIGGHCRRDASNSF